LQIVVDSHKVAFNLYLMARFLFALQHCHNYFWVDSSGLNLGWVW